MRKTNDILWIDMLILHTLSHSKDVLSQKQLLDVHSFITFLPRIKGGVINQWLLDNNVDRIFSPPLTSMSTVTSAVDKLRVVGFLSLSGKYRVTKAGYDFSSRYLSTHYTSWPYRILYSVKKGYDFNDIQYTFGL